MPKIIICIPTYNRPEQINSLFSDLENQKDQDFSLIILNDGANIETSKILKNKQPKFIFHFLESEKPSGLSGARNKILDYIEKNSIANEKTFVTFLDDDLIIENDFVSQIKKYSEKFDGFTFHTIQKGRTNIFSFANNKLLQLIFKPLIGRLLPYFGVVFGGFYLNSGKIRAIDHMMGCCIIYNFSKNKERRFDTNLNEGNYSGEDTEFTYGLKKAGNKLFFIGNYTYIHNSADLGGCREKDMATSYFWYWKHKLYIIKKYHSKYIVVAAKFACFLESILLSVIFRKNLVLIFFNAIKKYA